MMTYNYQRTEELLLRLLDLLTFSFSCSEQEEVREFIDVGEYGLAVETLVDIVCEENKCISCEAWGVICELAGIMEIDKGRFEGKLDGQVVEGGNSLSELLG